MELSAEAMEIEAMDDAGWRGLLIYLSGANQPGILASLMTVMGRPCYRVRLVDLNQYVIVKTLVLSIMLDHSSDSSDALIEELTANSESLGLTFDYRTSQARSCAPTPMNSIPMPVAAEYVDHDLLINVIIHSGMPLTLVHDIFVHIADMNASIIEIKQRPEDMINVNELLTKMALRIRCPVAVGVPQIYNGLRELCKLHAAHVAVRQWEGMDRPNGKSLVLFGLSNVLCPYDVNDMVLEEAGVDPSDYPIPPGTDPAKRARCKIQALKGKDSTAMQRATERMYFTHGAYFVCRALKEMGFKIAVLSNAGCYLMVQKAKRELGLDYAISRDLEVDKTGKFTGEYVGENKEEPFNKLDYSSLMAEREGIEPRNVTIVGTFSSGTDKESVRMLLETYGPMIDFHANKSQNPDLTMTLYLLGFSGLDVEQMRNSQSSVKTQGIPELPECSLGSSAEKDETVKHTVTMKEGFKRHLVRVRSERNDTRELASLLAPLAASCGSELLTLQRIQQVTLAGENAMLGIELNLEESRAEAVMEEVVVAAQRLGTSVALECSSREPDPSHFQRKQQYVVTVVERPRLSLEKITSLVAALGELGVDCRRLSRLSEGPSLSALEITAVVPPGMEKQLRERLLAISKEQEVDIAFQNEGIERWRSRVVVFDLDSTLIQQEVIDEVSRIVGVEAAVKEITDRAMRGELDFHESLCQRVALLKGQIAEDLFCQVMQGLTYTPGAHQLCRTLKLLGYKIAVISSGFLPVAREVQRVLGLDYAFANRLETGRDGILTGNTSGPVVTPHRKKALLSMIAQVEGCELLQTIAVGYGSNDIPMLTTAGLGVAFCAKPKVQDVVEKSGGTGIHDKDISTVLFLIGLSDVCARNLQRRQAAASGGSERVPRSPWHRPTTSKNSSPDQLVRGISELQLPPGRRGFDSVG